MAVRGSVKGRAELREIIIRLEVSSPAEMEKDLLTGTREGLKGIKADVQRSAAARLPKRHGYATLVARSVKVRTNVSGGKRVRAHITVTASGKRKNRDLPALNRGLLKHPLFGNRLRWYAQHVRSGLVDDPIDRARDRVVDKAREAADSYVRSVARG